MITSESEIPSASSHAQTPPYFIKVYTILDCKNAHGETAIEMVGLLCKELTAAKSQLINEPHWPMGNAPLFGPPLPPAQTSTVATPIAADC